jgi:CheY-like chemotaxis protein
MQARLKHLLGIPFRAIVTTNFDLLLGGMPPSAEAYRVLLRSPRPSPWREALIRVALSEQLVDDLPSGRDTIVQLHGRVDQPDSLVLTRSQYRRRLYADSAYLTVLRSLLATSTVLFLGYSLTDAYLNELRSELVEALSIKPIGKRSDDAPLAWAVLDDVSKVASEYYRVHEALGVIPYQANGDDHGGFDRILKTLYDQTNPIHRLGERLKGQRLLWLDPHPDNNALGRELLRAAIRDCACDDDCLEKRLIEVSRVDQAVGLLASGQGDFDLIISHWGYDASGALPAGAQLLRAVAEQRHKQRTMAPVVIFAGLDHELENRRAALRAGAAAYVTRWEDLMETFERLL